MRKLLNKRKKRTKVFIIMGLFVMLFVGIGYSYLKETLTINSNTEISSMKWDVHLENVKVTTGSIVAVNDPKIGIDKLSVTTSLDFTQPKQFYEYTVDVKNDGSIDAMIDSYDSTVLTEAQSKYLIYTATYSDGERVQNNQILKAGEKETIRVRIEVKEDLEKSDLPTDGDEIKITFKLNYVQADSDATDENKKNVSIERQNEGEITAGDIVTISKDDKSERFVVVNSDDTKLVLTTEYCLDSNGNQVSGDGYKKISFSKTAYWLDSSTSELKEEYAKDINNNPATLSGKPQPYVYDSNCNLKTKIDNYSNKISNLNVNVLKARLLTGEEAYAVGEINEQQYWSGSIRNSNEVSIMPQTDGMLLFYSPYSYTFGIRPVIEISINELDN